MSDSKKPDEWNRHNRDEAKKRAAQQESAGPAYKPVLTEPYANLSGSPGANDAKLDVAALVDEYERATAAERVAWLAVRGLVAHEHDSGPWNAWRDAVERTQQAARSLVNYGTGCSRGSRPERECLGLQQFLQTLQTQFRRLDRVATLLDRADGALPRAGTLLDKFASVLLNPARSCRCEVHGFRRSNLRASPYPS